MYLVAYHKMAPDDAIAAVRLAIETRNSHMPRNRTRLRPFTNHVLEPLIQQMIHGNDYNIASATKGPLSELLIDVPHPPVVLAKKPEPTRAQTAFLEYMLQERNYGTYVVKPRPEAARPGELIRGEHTHHEGAGAFAAPGHLHASSGML